MNTNLSKICCGVLSMVGAVAPATAAASDTFSAVQLLREGGCGGTVPPVRRLSENNRLDLAAEYWARGASPAGAEDRAGYRAASSASLHIQGPEAASITLLKQSGCRALMNKDLREIGVYRRGADVWIILGVAAPAQAQAPILASRALELINAARAGGARCGARSFAPAPPVKLSDTLAGVASGHALDMAQHNYFEHQDLAGRSPADRVRAVGYKEKLVGENIAYGPISADEVVQGWLDSPAHCENIMDPRFAEMGIAYAVGGASKHGLYWVQLLAAPRA